jgi:hypothetical protein
MTQSGATLLKSAELYDPATGKFSPTGSMASERQRYTATLLPDGRVLIAGGVSGGPTPDPIATAELYDPGAGTFVPTGSTPDDFIGLYATSLLNGRVLLMGLTKDASGSFSTAAELYDPAMGTFTATGALPDLHEYWSATTLRDGRVLVTGGETRTAQGALIAQTSTEADVYDPATGKFTPTGFMTLARSQSTATLLLDGRVLIVGGTDPAKRVTSAEVYDPDTGKFSLTGPTIEDIGYAGDYTSTLLLNGRVLIAGGNSTEPGAAAISAELYDPATGKFSATTPLLSRSYTAVLRSHTATLLLDGRVLIAGGISENLGLIWAELYQP